MWIESEGASLNLSTADRLRVNQTRVEADWGWGWAVVSRHNSEEEAHRERRRLMGVLNAGLSGLSK